MMPPFAFLALLQAAAPDTVVTVIARDGLQTAALVALVVLGAFLLLLLLVLAVLLLQLRKLNGTVKQLGGQALDRAQPLIDGGRSVADNMVFISDALRTDVERLNASVKALTARLHQASERMEERIEEFNALMEVVQTEAEDIFIDTASTVRGVKAGARSFGGRGRIEGGARGGAPAAADGHEEDEVFLTGGEPAADPLEEDV